MAAADIHCSMVRPSYLDGAQLLGRSKHRCRVSLRRAGYTFCIADGLMTLDSRVVDCCATQERSLHAVVLRIRHVSSQKWFVRYVCHGYMMVDRTQKCCHGTWNRRLRSRSYVGRIAGFGSDDRSRIWNRSSFLILLPVYLRHWLRTGGHNFSTSFI